MNHKKRLKRVGAFFTSIFTLFTGSGVLESLPVFADDSEEVDFDQNIVHDETEYTEQNDDANIVEEDYGAQYILDTANKEYVGESDKLYFANVMKVQLSFAKNVLPKELRSLDKYLQDDEDGDGYADSAEYYAGSGVQEFPLYELAEDSDYYVGYADLASLEKGEVVDYACAYNNDNAEKIEDIIYDYDTGLVYVPKKYQITNSEGKILVGTVQIQLLYVLGESTQDTRVVNKVFVNYDGVDGEVVESAEVTTSLYSAETTIRLARDEDALTSLDDATIKSVLVDGLLCDDDVYEYNATDGTLTLKMAPFMYDTVEINISVGVSNKESVTVDTLAKASNSSSLFKSIYATDYYTASNKGVNSYTLKYVNNKSNPWVFNNHVAWSSKYGGGFYLNNCKITGGYTCKDHTNGNTANATNTAKEGVIVGGVTHSSAVSFIKNLVTGNISMRTTSGFYDNTTGRPNDKVYITFLITIPNQTVKEGESYGGSAKTNTCSNIYFNSTVGLHCAHILIDENLNIGAETDSTSTPQNINKSNAKIWCGIMYGSLYEGTTYTATTGRGTTGSLGIGLLAPTCGIQSGGGLFYAYYKVKATPITTQTNTTIKMVPSYSVSGKGTKNGGTASFSWSMSGAYSNSGSVSNTANWNVGPYSFTGSTVSVVTTLKWCTNYNDVTKSEIPSGYAYASKDAAYAAIKSSVESTLKSKMPTATVNYTVTETSHSGGYTFASTTKTNSSVTIRPNSSATWNVSFTNPSVTPLTTTATASGTASAKVTVNFVKTDSITGDSSTINGGQFKVTVVDPFGNTRTITDSATLTNGKFTVSDTFTASIPTQSSTKYYLNNPDSTNAAWIQGSPYYGYTSESAAYNAALKEAQSKVSTRKDSFESGTFKVTVTEVTAPTNYKMGSTTSTTQSVNASRGSASANLTLANTGNASLTINKKNADGTANVAGASFKLVCDTTNTLMATWTTDSTGQKTVTGLIPGRTYTLTEVGVPTGYVTPATTTWKITMPNTQNATETKVINNFQVLFNKLDPDGAPLAGATIEIRQKSNNALKQTINTTGATVVLNGLTEGVTYVATETVVPAGLSKAKDIEFTPTFSTKQVANTVDMIDTNVKFHKKDPEGNYVPNCKMQILDSTGKVVYEFTTTSKGIGARNVEVNNTYTLHEAKAADGYVRAKDVSFAVKPEENIDVPMIDTQVFASKQDASGNEIAGAQMEVFKKGDDPATATPVDSWTSTTTPHAISNLELDQEYFLHEKKAPAGYVRAADVSFTPSATENKTVKMVDPQVILSKQTVAKKEVAGAKMAVYKGTDTTATPVDTWTTTTTPYAISNLELDTDYTVVELQAPDGYVKANPITVRAKVGESVTYTMIDPQVLITKKTVAGNGLAGSVLEVYKKGDTIGTATPVDTWTSTTEAHAVSGLDLNTTYILHEKTATSGYVRADDIEFKAKATEDYSFDMIDPEVRVHKLDVKGNFVAGAVLEVYEKGQTIGTDTPVDSWTTDGNYHMVKNLDLHKDYILHEKTAAKGYVRAADIAFTAEAGKVKDVKMLDIQVFLSKQTVKTKDAESKELAGAKLYVTDTAGNVVDSWTSTTTPHAIDNLDVKTKYTVWEETAPKNYVIATKFSITTPETENKTWTMYDGQVFVKLIDPDGNPITGGKFEVVDKDGNVVDTWSPDGTNHPVENLKAGESYTIKEVETPAGYVTALDKKITVKDNEVVTYDIMNGTVKVLKIDVKHEPLAGAELQLLDSKGNVVQEWTTGTEYVTMETLVDKEVYTLHEVSAPEGYGWAKDITITADATKNQEIRMVDSQVTVLKVDEKDQVVEGAQMRVVDMAGNVVDEWVSDGQIYGVRNLKVDTKYVLQEVKAPDGYVRAADIEFVSLKGENIEFHVVDPQITFSLKDSKGDYVHGAHMQVLDKDGKVVDEWDTTDEVHYINNLDVLTTYTIRETNSPDGYVYGEDIIYTTPEVNDHIDMITTIHTVYKVDTDGNELKGAKMAVIDKDTGKQVDAWTTGAKVVNLTADQSAKLSRGEIVRFTRTAGDNVVAGDTTDTNAGDTDTNDGEGDADADAGIDGQDDTADTDTEDVDVSAGDGDEVDDAVMPTEDEDVDYVIIPKGMSIEKLKAEVEGTDTADDTTADADNADADAEDTEDKSVIDAVVDFFTGTDDDEETSTELFMMMVVKGDTYNYYEIDANGYEIGHRISNTHAEKKYQIVELEAPAGYVMDAPQDMQIDGKTDRDYTFVDGKYHFTKADVSGAEIVGAQMEVYDTDGNLVDSWISSDEVHYIEGLQVGKKYVLKEVVAPNGYVQANAINFEVTGDKIETQFSMIDSIHRVLKQSNPLKDKDGNIVSEGLPIKGARLEVYTQDGTLVDSWVTGQHIIDTTEEMMETVDKEGIYYLKEAEVATTYGDDVIEQMKENMDIAIKKVVPDIDAVDEPTDSDTDAGDSDADVEADPDADVEADPDAEVEVSAEDDPDAEVDVDTDTNTDTDDYVEYDPEVGADGDEDLCMEDYVLRCFELLPYEADELQEITETAIAKVRDMDKLTSDNARADARQELYQMIEDAVQAANDAEAERKLDISEVYIEANEFSAGGYILAARNGDGTMSYTDIDRAGDEANHRVSGLVAGETYVLHEAQAPADFRVAEDMEFTAEAVTDVITPLTDEWKIEAMKNPQAIANQNVSTGNKNSNILMYAIAGFAAIAFVGGAAFFVRKKRA